MQDVSSQRKAAENSGFLFYCQALIPVRFGAFQKALFSALHGPILQKSLCFQYFLVGMSIFHPRERQMYSDSNLM